MPYREHFARRFRFQRVLQASLVFGGFFNLVLGTLFGLAPATATTILQVPRPNPEFYLQVLSTLAALLGCYYLLAASDVRRYSGVVALAITGRLLVGLVLLFAAASRPDLAGLTSLAAIELLLAAIHGSSWWFTRS